MNLINFIRQSLVISIVLLLPFQTAFSQGTYRPLQCAGEIPEEFRSLTAAKVQKAKAEDRSNERTKQERKSIDEFLLRNNYVIDELLSSGKILFGDPVTQYINEVADALLEDNPTLRSKLRFYTVKSAEANAFATNQGIIFVTLGLIAQVENEAQLAFVLAHEIAHFDKAHSINSVLENVKIYNETSSDRYGGTEKRLRLLSTFSKEKEFEADSIGFLRFVFSGFNKSQASSAMDVLYLSSMPYAEKEFKPDFLAFDVIEYPTSLRLDSITEFPYDSDDYDDSESTHPNIRKRKDRLDLMASKSQSASNRDNLLASEKFRSAQQISRDELIHLFLVDNQYIDALYSAYVRLEQEPNSQFLEESIAKSLYGITKYGNEKNLRSIGSGSKKSFGQIQQAHYLFESLNADQTNLISIRYLHDVWKKYHSPFIEKLMNDLIVEAQIKNAIAYEILETGINKQKEYQLERSKRKEQGVAELVVAENKEEVKEEEPKQTSKYEKYRVTKKESQVGVSTGTTKSDWEKYFHYAAVAPLLSEQFKIRFDSLSSDNKSNVENDEKFQAHIKKKEKYYARKGYSLGIDKVVFVDPFFFLVDRRKGVKLEDSEQGLFDFKTQLEDCAASCDLESEILFPKTMSANDVDKYNDMALMNSWVGERFTHDGENVEMIPLETEYTTELANEYNTDYFCYTGAFTSKETRNNIAGYIIGSIFIPYLLPFTIGRAFVPKHVTNYYYLLYNVRTGQSVWTTEREFNLKGNSMGISSIIYDTLYQTKKQGR